MNPADNVDLTPSPIRPFQELDADVKNGSGNNKPLSAPDSTTSQFEAQGVVTYSSLFKDPGQRSTRQHQAEGRRADPVTTRLLIQQWQELINTMGSEIDRFPEEKKAIQAELKQLGPLDTPDLTVTRQIAYLLTRLQADAVATLLHQREYLAKQLREAQTDLQALRLKQCVAEDECDHTRREITKTIRKRGAEPKADSLPGLFNELMVTPNPDLETGPNFKESVRRALYDEDDDSIGSHGAQEKQVLEKIRSIAKEHRDYHGLLKKVGLIG